MDQDTLKELHDIKSQLVGIDARVKNIEHKVDTAIVTDTERLNKHSAELDEVHKEIAHMKGAMSGRTNQSNLMISIAVAIGPIAAVLISKFL